LRAEALIYKASVYKSTWKVGVLGCSGGFWPVFVEFAKIRGYKGWGYPSRYFSCLIHEVPRRGFLGSSRRASAFGIMLL
jgi:hypothetical protein